MYQLRELDVSYLGLFLVVALTMLVVLKLLNPMRFRSMLVFWEGTSRNSEVNKPFVESRVFSLSCFLFRALIFGILIQVLSSSELSVNTFHFAVLEWVGNFILFWTVRTVMEGGLFSVIRQREGLFKLFFIRSIFKEKLAFFYGCLTLSIVFFNLTPLASQVIAISYLAITCIIHIRSFKLYFKHINAKRMYIILYICASEIAPIWLLTQILNF